MLYIISYIACISIVVGWIFRDTFKKKNLGTAIIAFGVAAACVFWFWTGAICAVSSIEGAPCQTIEDGEERVYIIVKIGPFGHRIDITTPEAIEEGKRVKRIKEDSEKLHHACTLYKMAAQAYHTTLVRLVGDIDIKTGSVNVAQGIDGDAHMGAVSFNVAAHNLPEFAGTIDLEGNANAGDLEKLADRLLSQCSEN